MTRQIAFILLLTSVFITTPSIVFCLNCNTIGRQLIIKSLKALNQNDVQNAVADLQQSIEADPNNAESFILLSQILLRIRQYDQAAEILEYAVRFSPDNANLFYLLSIAELLGGHKPQALLSLQRSDDLFQLQESKQLFEIINMKLSKLHEFIVSQHH